MDKRKNNKGRNNQNHNSQKARFENGLPCIPAPKPTSVEIHLPDMPNEDEYMTISRDEYTDLIAATTLLDVIDRWAKAHNSYSKIDFAELNLLLGIPEEKE